MPPLALVGALLLVPAAGAPGSPPHRPTVAPVPRWVEPIAPERTATPAAPDGPRAYEILLVDEQGRVAGGTRERFTHRAKRVTSPAGIEQVSEIEIDFDPSYQELVLHYVRLLRGEQILDALRPGEIKVIQKEEQLDRRIFNGALSALLFLRDVRVGDVVDLAYTIRGQNPIFGNHFMGQRPLAQDVPVARLRVRLLWPADRPLQARTHGIDLAPRIRPLGAEREYLWERRNVPAVPHEDRLPVWYDAWPWLELSDFASWNEVARWALPLYVPGRRSTALDQQIARWRALPEGEARVLAAVHFVQDEVRYLGIELGASSHQPHAPAEVFERRYGDCKDKALLLVAILGALGVEAHPALINTSERHLLDERLPSPIAFDHVVLQAVVGGRPHWIDATQSAQGGSLDALAFPPFARALVVRADTAGLSTLTQPARGEALESVEERYRISDDGSPVDFEVLSRYAGREADRKRHQLARLSPAEMGKQFLNFYSHAFSRIEARGALEVTDDRARNVVAIHERYAIPEFWAEDERELYPADLADEVRLPRIERRTMPLGLEHPVDIAVTKIVEAPWSWDVRSESQTLEDPALRFTYTVVPHGHTLRLAYRFQSLQDAVPTAEVEKHLVLVRKIRGLLGYTLRRGAASSGRGGETTGLFVLGAVVSGVVLLFAGRGVRRRVRRARLGARYRHGEGEAPATAIPVAPGEIEARLRSRRCRCGKPLGRAADPDETVLFGEQRLTVVRAACPACGAAQPVYFAISPPSPR